LPKSSKAEKALKMSNDRALQAVTTEKKIVEVHQIIMESQHVINRMITEKVGISK
jgi:hypothetical protein